MHFSEPKKVVVLALKRIVQPAEYGSTDCRKHRTQEVRFGCRVA